MRELDDARYKAIGARIRDVRLQRNMSQAELAEKAFISVPHMSEVENGKTKLRLSTFVYITEALQVSADVLLRTNTPEVNGIYQGEFNDLLADCSPAEIDSIIKIVKELKTTMRMKKDDYLFLTGWAAMSDLFFLAVFAERFSEESINFSTETIIYSIQIWFSR